MIKIIPVFIIVLCVAIGCNEAPEELPQPIEWNNEKSSQLSKDLAENKEIEIKLFLEMHQDWEMIRTGSGLLYYIYEKGDGESPVAGDKAEIEYTVYLLDGTRCYGTASDEYEEVKVDQSDIESGIQEAIKKLKVGDKAKLIIPNHLGQGMIGDLNKIPPLATLLVDIELIGIVKK